MNSLVKKYEYLTHSEPIVKESSREVWSRMLSTAWNHMKQNAPEPGYTTRIEMTDGPRFTSELPEIIIAGWRDAVIGAKDKEVDELNEMEKFAIAYFSGVPAEFDDVSPKNPNKWSLRWRTKVKVGIYKAEGKFYVVHEPNPL
jgi:hypothetical protein